MSNYQKFREEQMKDPEFRAYCDEMQAEEDIAKAILAGRIRLNLSQKELAKLTGVHQADISRFENCEGKPSLKTLKRIAKGMGMMVRIEFVPISGEGTHKD